MIKAAGLIYTYPGEGKPSIDDVSMQVVPGEMLGVIGSAGSGKSTLLQLLSGIMSPEAGELLVENGGLRGLVMQFPEDQFFEDTVLSDVEFGPRARGMSRREARLRASRALSRMGLDADLIGGMSPFSLTADEARRAAIAGVLAIEPTYLMLDEPTVGMDGKSRDLLWNTLRDLVDHYGLSVVVASHDLDELAAACDRVVIVGSGKIVAQGVPAEVVMNRDKLEQYGVGAPMCLELSELLSRSGIQATPSQVLTAIT